MTPPPPERSAHRQLVEELRRELTAEREYGQPLILEEPFARTEERRVTVFWDRFSRLDDDERTLVILDAYDQNRPDALPRIAVAVGYTFPEAEDEAVLPYQVAPQLRSGDHVTAEQCHQAMIELGASTLRDPEHPSLSFPSPELAKQCVDRLIAVLPESKDVWTIRGSMRGQASMFGHS
jgi:hypothetical protein